MGFIPLPVMIGGFIIWAYILASGISDDPEKHRE